MKIWKAAALMVLAGLATGLRADDKVVPAAKIEPAKSADKAPESKAATLKVGDKAPAISADKWLKGDAITGFEKGRVYVVEFWATWCPPCLESIPHLTELQSEYKDKGVTIVGMASSERKGKEDKRLENLEKFIAKMGDTMSYTVAYDGNRAMSGAWMEPADQKFIPTSFVVDQNGTLAYIGSPMTLDLVLGDVVAGKWDIQKGPERVKGLMDKFEEAMKAAAQDEAKGLEQVLALEKAEPKLASMLTSPKFMLQLRTGDSAGASATGKAWVEKAIKTKNVGSLNEVAWMLVDPTGGVKNPDLDLAMKAASEAARLTENKEGAILDTLARVYFLKGDKAKAIETQKKAIELAPERMKKELTETLKEYETSK